MGRATPLCAGLTFPEFIFSYASGSGPVTTSPIPSLDGTKIAYVENSPKIGAVLHVLTFGSGATEYGTCTKQRHRPADLRNCPGDPRQRQREVTANDFMIPLSLATFGVASSNTYSAPFVNYSTDTLFVGDDQGHLYSVRPGVSEERRHLPVGTFPSR